VAAAERHSPDTEIAFVLFRRMRLPTRFSGRSPTSLVDDAHRYHRIRKSAAIEFVVRAGAKAVISKPIRAFGLLTSMIVAHTLSERINVSSERIVKLESRLAGLKKIEQAKSILMAKRGYPSKKLTMPFALAPCPRGCS